MHLQRTGHLHGRTLQEWSIVDHTSKAAYSSAVESLRACLYPGIHMLAVRHFRHNCRGPG